MMSQAISAGRRRGTARLKLRSSWRLVELGSSSADKSRLFRISAVQPLHVELMFDEAFCEVVEQRGIDRRVGQVQVISWLYDTHIEVGGPDAVDEGFGEQRVFR
jgi:hypothetical protein